MEAYLEDHEHRLVEGAAEVVQKLTARGDEVVFVSNSKPEKLASMLGAAGISEGDGVRVIGDARKWWIGDDERGSFWCSGFEFQRVICVPTTDLVVVRLGKTPEDAYDTPREWLNEIVALFD